VKKVSPNRYGRKKKSKDAKERAEKEENARYDWMSATEDLVKLLNARFMQAASDGSGQHHLVGDSAAAPGAAAATTSPAAGSNASAASRAGQFPLKLHEGANIVSEYHVCWPDDLPKRLRTSKTPSLAVHYVRTEETATMSKLNTHYVAQLKGVTSRPRSYGRWLDWMGQGVAHGQARTVDVLLTRAGGGGGGDDDDASARRTGEIPEPMVTEILVIEIPEYRTATADESASTK